MALMIDPRTAMLGALPNAAERIVVFKQLMRTADTAESIAPAAWGVTLFANGFRLNAGSAEAMTVGDGLVRLMVSAKVDHESLRGLTAEATDYVSVRGEQCVVECTPADFCNVVDRLNPLHQKYLLAALTTKSGDPVKGTRFRRSHSEPLLKFVRRQLDPSTPIFETSADLSPLQREHFDVASSFDGEEFTTAAFIERFRSMFANRNASSILPSDYSHNNAQAAREFFPSFLEAVSTGVYRFVGLDVGQDEKRRNPNWTRDELILAAEFYKRHAPQIPSKTDRRLLNLVEDIRQLANALGLQGDDTFRNANGVYMKLMELRKYDADYLGKGLGRRPRAVEAEVFALSLEQLAAIADLMRGSLSEAGQGEFAAGLASLGWEEADEGALLTRVHVTRERNREIVREKKRAFAKEHGRLFCQACEFDFVERYGERGHGFIECHHTVPISEMEAGAKTKIADLSLLCANCHRMIHARRPWLTIDQLKLLLDPMRRHS